MLKRVFQARFKQTNKQANKQANKQTNHPVPQCITSSFNSTVSLIRAAGSSQVALWNRVAYLEHLEKKLGGNIVIISLIFFKNELSQYTQAGLFLSRWIPGSLIFFIHYWWVGQREIGQKRMNYILFVHSACYINDWDLLLPLSYLVTGLWSPYKTALGWLFAILIYTLPCLALFPCVNKSLFSCPW